MACGSVHSLWRPSVHLVASLLVVLQLFQASWPHLFYVCSEGFRKKERMEEKVRRQTAEWRGVQRPPPLVVPRRRHWHVLGGAPTVLSTGRCLVKLFVAVSERQVLVTVVLVLLD